MNLSSVYIVGSRGTAKIVGCDFLLARKRKVAKVLQDLPEQFQLLFRDNYKTVLRKLISLVSDQSIAEDLAQEVFLRLYRKPPDDLSVVGAWLHRVLTRVAYDYTRQNSRLKRIEEQESRIGALDVAEPSSELLVIRHAERETVKEVLQQLSDRDRQVLLLRYSGYSYAEIADLVGVNPAIVGSILNRAQARFKKRYPGEEELENERETHAKGCYTV